MTRQCLSMWLDRGEGAVPPFDILVVEDFQKFREFVCSLLLQRQGFRITQASDGIEALQKAEQLQPDLISLDISLPNLNGIEVCKRVRQLVPRAQIVFVTVESDPSVVQEAMNSGAMGYVHKLRVGSDLLSAIDAVLKGEQFVSNGLKFDGRIKSSYRHEVLFCSDDAALLDGLALFLAAALNVGDPAIVWATESHREGLRQRLHGLGVDADAAVQRGTYISSDVSEPPDPERILVAIRSLRDAALQMGKKRPRVSLCGERAGLFWAEGKTDAALRLEQLLNELAESYDIQILCVYPLPQSQEEAAFNNVCAEHTAVDYH